MNLLGIYLTGLIIKNDAINSETDVKIQGVSVTDQALNDAVAMAIALG